MTRIQIFILIFLLGGAISMGFFLMGLGIYYWGKNAGSKNKSDGMVDKS